MTTQDIADFLLKMDLIQVYNAYYATRNGDTLINQDSTNTWSTAAQILTQLMDDINSTIDTTNDTIDAANDTTWTPEINIGRFNIHHLREILNATGAPITLSRSHSDMAQHIYTRYTEEYMSDTYQQHLHDTRIDNTRSWQS